MKPVTQTLFGDPAGNCLMACIASILEVPLESLPDLWEREQADEDWWDVIRNAVRVHGWEATWIYSQWANTDAVAPQGYAIAGGPSPRANGDGDHPGHAVVCLDGEMVHDPHPDGAGLCGPIDIWYLLIPPKGWKPAEQEA